MKIAFLLPDEGDKPTGGFKVVYEYANGLASRGHEVHVVHFASVLPTSLRKHWRTRVHPLRYLWLAMRGTWGPATWFHLVPEVHSSFRPILTPAFLPVADAYVATWWTTAERLGKFSALSGRRFYLIQHLETWFAPEAEVLATWRAPLEKIVISRWLQDIATSIGERSAYIPNGLSFDAFGCDVPQEERFPRKVAMVYDGRLDWKGWADGMKALLLLKEQYPDLRADLFGVHDNAAQLPSWVKYYQRPSQVRIRQIYNEAAVFLAPSRSEGWGLPPCEAMLCGAAVVATDIGGHREFCIDQETALLVPVQDPEAMAQAASRLMDNMELRYRIAKRSETYIRRFSWDAATDAFERLLSSPPNVT